MNRPLRILIVDDSEDDALLIRYALKKGGFEVASETVDTPSAMREKLESENWEVIISDNSMPKFNALEVLALAMKFAPDVPVIIVSGEISLNLAVAIMRGGAKDFIPKRELALLVPAIERELNEARLHLEKKKADAAIAILESRYRRLFETAKEGILVLDADTGQVADVNPQLMKMLGYSMNEFLGKELWEIGLFHDKNFAKYVYQELQDNSYFRDDNLSLQTKGKKLVAVEFVGNVYIVDNARIAQCDIRDISASKQVADALRDSQSTLKKAQQFAHFGSWTWKIKTGELEWSDQMFQIFGLEKTTFTGSLEEVIAQAIYPDDRSKVEQVNLAVIQQKKPSPLEYRVIWPDQSIHVVWAEAGELLLDEEGNPDLLSGIVIDITARKKAEEQIRNLNTELERRVAERTAQLEAIIKELETFSYSASHDLRAPLRRISGFVRILLDDYADKLDDNGKNYLSLIQGASSRMDLLINNLLMLSRVTGADFNRQQVDLSLLASNIADELKSQSPQRVVEFNIKIGMIVEGDRNFLKIALENLLSNAFKFTSKREQAIIEVGIVENDDRHVYFIRDNGAGYKTEDSEKLFIPFKRLHSEKEFPGTGIGLATVKRIIQRHGGNVWAEGEENKGATFYFTLDSLH